VKAGVTARLAIMWLHHIGGVKSVGVLAARVALHKRA
jgi:hypothetical protein